MPRRPLLLVVEDDKVLRDLYRVALSLSNFEVHACEDGLDALHYLDQSRPDVIVLDLDLPRISGTVLYAEMLARPRADRVPIVVVTGMEKVPALPRAVVLRKPVTPEQLIRVIDSTLARRDRAWLYVRDRQAVRIARVAYPGPDASLHVFGPGPARSVYTCRDLVDCLARQAQIERELVAEGYQLLARDRRSGRDRRMEARPEPDRRCNLSELNT
jgi:two-component system, chemotaxis family, chemotaxis protein CheY